MKNAKINYNKVYKVYRFYISLTNLQFFQSVLQANIFCIFSLRIKCTSAIICNFTAESNLIFNRRLKFKTLENIEGAI